MVFQRPNPFPKSIYDNVAWGLKVLGMKDGLNERVEKALTQAALWDEVKDRLKTSALGLSGGQQQRLCIARAIAVEPDVVLMDEPASALDPIATQKIEELMHELKSEYTFVIVTHNMQQAARVADMTAFFSISRGEEGERWGELVEYDATEKIFTAPVRQADGGLRHRPLRLSRPVFPSNRLLLSARDTPGRMPSGVSDRDTVPASNRLLQGRSRVGKPCADLEAAAGLARRLHLAAGRRDDVLHDRQPEPGAAARARLVAAVEALEQARQVGCVDTLRRRRRPSSTGPPPRSSARSCSVRPRAGVADRVREQVLDHDAEHPRPQRHLDAARPPGPEATSA